MLITLYKLGELHFSLLGTNGFHVKAKSERFTAASSHCCQNLKYENFTSSFGRLRQKIAPKCVPHVQHDYFSSFNQWNHWFVALSLTSSNLKFPYVKTLHQKSCRTCSTIIFLHSTNEIIDLWRCRWRSRRQILNSLTSKHCTKNRAARAARLFFFIQPIKSLICGVVVDVAVVKS